VVEETDAEALARRLGEADVEVERRLEDVDKEGSAGPSAAVKDSAKFTDDSSRILWRLFTCRWFAGRRSEWDRWVGKPDVRN
jgi:hypothetical protein